MQPVPWDHVNSVFEVVLYTFVYGSRERLCSPFSTCDAPGDITLSRGTLYVCIKRCDGVGVVVGVVDDGEGRRFFSCWFFGFFWYYSVSRSLSRSVAHGSFGGSLEVRSVFFCWRPWGRLHRSPAAARHRPC